MRRVLTLGVLLLSVVSFRAATAREFKVRLLKGNMKTGYWGTREFQVRVTSLGTLRNVKVRGKEVIWQAAALYTHPVPPGAKKGVRTVQGETPGTRGLTVELPKFKTRDDNGTRIFEYKHLIANKKVLDGKPLCKVRQKIVITPTGEIHVDYDFEWLETVYWYGFGHLLFFTPEACANRDYMLLSENRVLTGKLDPGPRAGRRVRFKNYEQFTLRPEVGPVHLVWHGKSTCSLTWPKAIQLHMSPSVILYRKSVPRGQKDRLSYSILLPVSQQ